MRKPNHLLTWGFLCGAILVLNVGYARADATVYVSYSGFSPNSVTINVHETVYFIVADDWGPYCIQSTIGAWPPWYLFDEGDGFGLTINEVGNYYYRDIFTGNTGVIHVGSAPPVTLHPPKVVGGQFQFQVTGLALGRQAVLESSSSLGPAANWLPLQTNIVDSEVVSFTQPVLPGTRFFRLVQLP